MHSDSDFRAATDQMLDMIQRLSGLERAKQDTPVGTDEFIRLAHETQQLARVVFRWADMQLQMAERSPEAVRRGELSGGRLSSVQARPLERILASWREASLRLEIAKPGTVEAAAAADDVERLREEFRAATGRRPSAPGAEPASI